MPNSIDPLDYEERLTQAGVPAEQAHVHAEAIGQVKTELDAIDERANGMRIECKVDQGFAKIEKDLDAMNTKIDTGLAKLDAKIDSGLAKLDAKIDRNRAELEAMIEKAKWETICWTIGIVIAICSLQGVIIVNVLR